jgi:hypothetical protein
VRGEEYSAQIDHFVQCMKTGSPASSNFRSASDAVLVTSMMRADAEKQRALLEQGTAALHAAAGMSPGRGNKTWVQALFGRLRQG